jgi:uncharacterized protein with ParB-like and HNH nuclease domain
MEATPVRIVQYFDGEKQSIIPLFQRPYTWGRRNWQSLWDDILSLYDDNTETTAHFMGAVVSIPARTVPVGVTKHLIIDGQQRLTTAAILLCVLRDCLDEKRGEQIQDYLVNRHYGESADHLKLLPTQGDRDAYLGIVKSRVREKTPTHLIHECYNFFKNKILGKSEDEEKIIPEKILEIVKLQLQVVMINLGESDDPYSIFESLNFKGEPLAQADLIRNYILMRFRYSLGEDGEQERIYREIWNPMESRLGQNLESFLWHYAIKDGENVKKPRVYTVYKQKFRLFMDCRDLEPTTTPTTIPATPDPANARYEPPQRSPNTTASVPAKSHDAPATKTEATTRIPRACSHAPRARRPHRHLERIHLRYD